MTFKLITNGDRWTFGSEIVDSAVVNKHLDKKHVTEFDFFEENDSYRIAKNTFKGFIDSKFKDPYNKTWHPRPESHLTWAEELHRYMTVNKIIN